MKKIKVYTAKANGSTLYAMSLEDLFETLKNEIGDIEDGDTWEFEFGSKYLTQEEIDSSGEFDGF